MAAPARIVTVNLGSQSISVGDFRPHAGGGLVLREVQRREILSDSPPLPPAQITSALEEMLATIGVKGGTTNYAISGQSVFARFVKLPAVEEEKIERIIAFEAQQNVPFPIDEVVWDYQLVSGGADEQLQVVLVAVKSDLLEGLNGAVEAAGLRPVVIDVATMALYNAFRYNYSDVTEPSLLIDLGARTTNLLFIERGKVFTRSVPVGGSSVTSALAKEFSEPMAMAESRKKAGGFVSLGGAYAEPSDPDLARMSKIIRTTMTRLHAEIMRSISHYRSQQNGNAPTRIYLCGGSAGIPYMREFFQEKLQAPLEFFNPLRNVAVAPEANAKEIASSAHLLGEVVGLALRAVSSCPMELNLRPASVVSAQEVERRRPFLVAAVACVVLALLGWSAYYARGASALASGKQRLDASIDSLRGYQTQIDAVKKDARALDEVADPLLDAIKARGFWPRLLDDLNTRLPKENIWITELIPLSGGKPVVPTGVQIASSNVPSPTPAPLPRGPKNSASGPVIDGLLIRGLYLSNPRQQEVVTDYFKNLTRSVFFAIDPNNQQRAMRPTMPNNTEWAFPYELQLDLKEKQPLP
ncbi:MAG: type IV pilus assembly protein PilM [Verrucomicrobiota bacterium]|nr:type IV pilus assembly protein PilM [Verrucomicrobiota bacterium]